jgi:hypothetical protein
VDQNTDAGAGSSVVSKLGSSVKKAVADRKATREDAAREHQERAAAAGALVTSGVFGTSTIEIYENGYVRIAEGSDRHTQAEKVTKSTPYEKLRSISFEASDSEKEKEAAAPSTSALEGAVMQTMSGLMRGGKVLVKGTAVGLATSAVSHLASNAARKSNLVIATDKTIHILGNQKHNGYYKVSQKEHTAVALSLVEAGNLVLGITQEPELEIAVQASVISAEARPASLSDRLRELSVLHQDGILSDDEFSAAKAKLLNSL